MKQIDGCLFYMIVYLALLLVPSVKYLEPLKIIGQITCTAVLLCYFYSRMYSTDIKIDNHSLFSGEWREVFYFFGILLFSFVPVVQVRTRRQENVILLHYNRYCIYVITCNVTKHIYES